MLTTDMSADLQPTLPSCVLIVTTCGLPTAYAIVQTVLPVPSDRTLKPHFYL